MGVSVMELQRALLRARAYRTEAVQLAAQLRRATVRAAKLKRAATALGAALEEERAKRRELQAAVRQVVANRDAAVEAEEQEGGRDAEEEEEEEGGQDDVDMEEAEAVAPALPAPRVVVLRPTGQPEPPAAGSNVEYAGCVVVVRPRAAAAPVGGAAPAAAAPASSARKTPVVVVSARKAAATPAPRPASSHAASVRKTPAAGALAAGKTPGGWGVGSIAARRELWGACLGRGSLAGAVGWPQARLRPLMHASPMAPQGPPGSIKSAWLPRPSCPHAPPLLPSPPPP